MLEAVNIWHYDSERPFASAVTIESPPIPTATTTLHSIRWRRMCVQRCLEMYLREM